MGSNTEVCVLWSNEYLQQPCLALLLRLYYRAHGDVPCIYIIENLIRLNQASTVFWEPHV